MNQHNGSKLTRRWLLASFAGIAGAAVVSRAVAAEPDASDAVPRKVSEVQRELKRLLALWQEERKAYGDSSNTYDYWKGQNGKAIIALGPAILPDLIQQVKAGDFFFNVPLAIITKVDIANGEYESEQANSKLWVKWWEAAQNAPTE